MKLFGRELEGIPKILVVLTGILLVSSGLCGVQYVISSEMHSGLDNQLAIFAVTGVLEFGAIAVSALGIAVFLLFWLVSSVGTWLYERHAGQSKNRVRRLFDEETQQSKDDKS